MVLMHQQYCQTHLLALGTESPKTSGLSLFPLWIGGPKKANVVLTSGILKFSYKLCCWEGCITELVNLVGYCAEKGEHILISDSTRILVTEFLPELRSRK